MQALLQRPAAWIALWLVLGLGGSVLVLRASLGEDEAAFETNARIAHRLLSQQMVQHEAVLATLTLAQPQEAVPARLASLFPQIVDVRRRSGDAAWGSDSLASAEQRSRASGRSVVAAEGLDAGRYRLVLASAGHADAITIDLPAVVRQVEWPFTADPSVRAVLREQGLAFVVQPGEAGGVRSFEFAKHLGSPGQPFDLVVQRPVQLAQLPWAAMAAWLLAAGAGLAVTAAWLAQRRRRLLAERMLRRDRLERLNLQGELAAGLAHELNQPLAAMLANAQAAARLLREDPPEVEPAQQAMDHAVRQARRAADVLQRLRRMVQQPGEPAPSGPVRLQEAVRVALDLLGPELARNAVQAQVHEPSEPVTVMADAVALEQIVHNLVLNAVQVLAKVGGKRELVLRVARDGEGASLTVADNGPGIAPELLPRIFEPFVTTREDGLGLGLALCETLAGRMGGRLQAGPREGGGAEFKLSLPLAALA